MKKENICLQCDKNNNNNAPVCEFCEAKIAWFMNLTGDEILKLPVKKCEMCNLRLTNKDYCTQCGRKHFVRNLRINNQKNYRYAMEKLKLDNLTDKEKIIWKGAAKYYDNYENDIIDKVKL